MRILEQRGSRYLPAIDAVTGLRMPDMDLLVALGASFDPRRSHPGPKKIIVAAPSRPPRADETTDPSEVRVSRWLFNFEPREIDGEPALCMVMTAEGDATPFSDMPLTDEWGDFFFNLAGEYARLCK